MPSRADEEPEKPQGGRSASRLPEPWTVSATWHGWRGGGEEISVKSTGAARLRGYYRKKASEGRVDAKHLALIAEHAVHVFNRFQMYSHEIEDGVTTNWMLTAGSGTVKFRNRGGEDVREPVVQVWNQATHSGAADGPGKASHPPDGPPRSRRTAGKKLLDKSVERDAYRLKIRVRGADAAATSVVTMNHRGEFRWNSVIDPAFGLDLGISSRTLNEIDGGEILDLTAAAIESFGFAEPRDAPEGEADRVAAKRSRAELFIESGLGNEDYMVEVIETGLNNNQPFKDAVRKLIDTAKKHARLEAPSPND
jgi:hypothetical protein